MIDFSKAFDTLNHDMLLAKLHYFGFSNNAIPFLKSYISDRFHYVAVTQVSGVFKSDYVSIKVCPARLYFKLFAVFPLCRRYEKYYFFF